MGDTAYPIPEAIKALPGYGWSAGTARNYVDYENKQYVQCVQSVDLGTLSWVAGVGGKVSFQTSQVTGQKLTKIIAFRQISFVQNIRQKRRMNYGVT